MHPVARAQDGSRQCLRIVTVAPLEWESGLEYALLGLRRLLDRGQDARLTLIGTGTGRAHVLFTRCDLGLHDRVVLVDPGAPDAEREVAEADVYLHPRLPPGPSEALLRAAAEGKPVVAVGSDTDTSALAARAPVLVVPPRDPDAIAAALLRLASGSPVEEAG